jgi:hypothetical protein
MSTQTVIRNGQEIVYEYNEYGYTGWWWYKDEPKERFYEKSLRSHTLKLKKGE